MITALFFDGGREGSALREKEIWENWVCEGKPGRQGGMGQPGTGQDAQPARLAL